VVLQGHDGKGQMKMWIVGKAPISLALVEVFQVGLGTMERVLVPLGVKLSLRHFVGVVLVAQIPTVQSNLVACKEG